MIGFERAKRTLFWQKRFGWTRPIASYGYKSSSIREGVLARDYVGSLIIIEDGRILETIGFRKLDVVADSYFEWCFSMLIGSRELKMEVSTVSKEDLSFFKTTVASALRSDAASARPFASREIDLDALNERLAAAKTFREVFKVVGVPSLSDCAPVLVSNWID